MEKRVVFRSTWLPWLLVAPQLAIVIIFFFWPAGQALLQSVQQEDAFGASVEFVGLENFRHLWQDASYLASFKITLLFSALVAALGLALLALDLLLLAGLGYGLLKSNTNVMGMLLVGTVVSAACLGGSAALLLRLQRQWLAEEGCG